jgi:KaiC/GvpD/RAD55 family RecA-like ATPase
MKKLTPNKAVATQFLSLLDPNASAFTFQTFDDNQDRKDGPRPKVLHGSLDEHFDKLSYLNQEGAGVFVTVNRTDLNGRKRENIVGIRAVFQEADNGNEPELPLEPNLVVESSPGKRHCYLLTDSTKLDEFTGVQQRLVKDFGSDPNAADIGRVLRLPGFNHQKVSSKKGLSGKPFMVRIISHNNERYAWEDIKAALPPCGKANTSDGKQRSQADITPETLKHLKSALSAIPADDRGIWVKVGLALWKLGDTGYELWLDWSRTAPDKFDPQVAAETWKDFKPSNIGYRSIFHIATEHGWVNPKMSTFSRTTKEYGTISLEKLLTTQFPPRGKILHPWLPEKGLVLIFAEPGVGKTFLALSVAYAVANQFLAYLYWIPRWKRTRVLYIDGEMAISDIQKRFSLLVGDGDASKAGKNLTIMNPELQEGGMPDLSTEKGQASIKEYTDQADLIVIDNISCLCRTGEENSAESWALPQEWAIRMRAEGRSVLFVHHAGKGKTADGDPIQRGTSKREDVMDTVIVLRRPATYSPDQGAQFELRFRKSRGFYGKDAEPMYLSIKTKGNKLEWLRTTLTEDTYSRVIALTNEGLAPGEIAENLGVHKSTVSKHQKRAREEGRISAKEK